MYKVITFESVSSIGQHFAEAIDITHRGGGGLEKMAGERHPEVERYLRSLRPDSRYQYVLMTPMGAFETWGMNRNGDIFPEAALKYDLTKDDPGRVVRFLEQQWLRPHGRSLPPGRYYEFGHKTFLDARRYMHHANKDPSIAYGDITLAVWNPTMRRVEVIVRHDREKAKRVGAEEVIADIDEGKPRNISMGCKVPFDICTSCGSISKTTSDYCDCLRFSMGRMGRDGKVIGAVNLFPRFHDLSDVTVQAAKESGVLEKVAELRLELRKVSRLGKGAAIDKEVLPNSTNKAMSAAMDAEPDLPRGVIERGDFSRLLATLAGMGIIMKPHEFQRGMLCRMGGRSHADDLDKRGVSFRYRPRLSLSRMDPDMFDSSLASSLSGLLRDRSGLYPHLPSRVIRVSILRIPRGSPRRSYEGGPILSKIAGAYSDYRGSLSDMPRFLDHTVSDNPAFYSRYFLSELLADSMTKLASSPFRARSDSPLVPMYVYSAYSDCVMPAPSSWDMASSEHSPARALLAPTL